MALSWTISSGRRAATGLGRDLMRWLAALRASRRNPDLSERTDADNAALAYTTLVHSDAFDHFFAQREHQIFGYLYRMTSDQHLASDLCQETFLRAWQHFDKIATYRDPVGWLFRVATNLACNARRDRLRHLHLTRPLGDDEEPASGDPTARFADHQLVHQILQGLSPRARAGLVLREVYGMSLEEVALTLQMSQTATKKMLSRARERFRTQYLREGA